MDDQATSTTSVYDFKAPYTPLDDGETGSLLTDLIATRAFRRLKQVRFLGAIDYALIRRSNGKRGHTRYTRYQHSLGVACLALAYAKAKALEGETVSLLAAAALLHDVGHAPLSHSLEPTFREAFGIDHHRATRELIRGKSPFGRDILDILKNREIDPERLIALIEGQDQSFDGFFSGPINFDTIEGICRSQRYGIPSPVYDSPLPILNAAIHRRNIDDRDIVDQFWRHKHYVYTLIVNSEAGVLADFVARDIMGKHIDRFVRADYFRTENWLFRTIPELREILNMRPFASAARLELQIEIPYRIRRFTTDETADFFSRDDKRRYRQSKNDCFLSAEQVRIAVPGNENRGLFDDTICN